MNGTKLFYVVDGDGPPCIVLHGGLGLDHTLYRKTLGSLMKHFQVIYLDQRCNGKSERAPLETLTMEQLADDVVGLADHLGIEKFFVLGQSYGGNVALQLMCSAPERLLGAILIGTTCGPRGRDEEPHPEATRPDALTAIWEIPPETDARSAEQWFEAAPYFTNPETVDELRDAMSDTVFSAGALVRSDAVFWGWSVTDRLSDVHVPALVIHGSADRIWHPLHGERIARLLPDATLVVLEGGNHFPWIETPSLFYDAIDRWLAAEPS